MHESKFIIPTTWNRGRNKLAAKTIDQLDLYAEIKPKGQEQAQQLWDWIKSKKPLWKDLNLPFNEIHDFSTMVALNTKQIELSSCEVKKKGCFFNITFVYMPTLTKGNIINVQNKN